MQHDMWSIKNSGYAYWCYKIIYTFPYIPCYGESENMCPYKPEPNSKDLLEKFPALLRDVSVCSV